MLISKSSVDVALPKPRPLASAIDPRGALPGVFGGKDCFIVFAGTCGEKLGRPGREYRECEVRNMLRGVVEAPEKLVARWEGVEAREMGAAYVEVL
jgi:hypothetical protein